MRDRVSERLSERVRFESLLVVKKARYKSCYYIIIIIIPHPDQALIAEKHTHHSLVPECGLRYRPLTGMLQDED